MTFFLILFAFSFIGISALLLRGFSIIGEISEEELLSRRALSKPFWDDFRKLIVAPTVRIHREKVLPKTYKEIEKLTRRFRLIALRVECLLMRFSEYIRGKRIMADTNDHKSHYWEQLNNRKNGANKENKDLP